MNYPERFCSAVHELIATNQSLSISAIARKMGVTRQAIYYHIYKVRGEQ